MSKEKKQKTGLGKFLLGAGIGAGLGVLFAPKKGSETRKDLKIKIDELIAQAKNIDIDEVRDNFEDKIENIKAELEDLDKEKVLQIAQDKAKDVQNKLEELLEYAKEKGTPLLEKTAKTVKDKAIDFTKQVLTKLEEN